MLGAADAGDRRFNLLTGDGEVRLIEQAVLLFQRQDAAHGFVDPRLVNLAVPHQLHSHIRHVFDVPELLAVPHVGQDEHIHARVDGQAQHVFVGEVVRDRRHAQPVGDDHAHEAHVVPQDVRQDGATHGGGQADLFSG